MQKKASIMPNSFNIVKAFNTIHHVLKHSLLMKVKEEEEKGVDYDKIIGVVKTMF